MLPCTGNSIRFLWPVNQLPSQEIRLTLVRQKLPDSSVSSMAFSDRHNTALKPTGIL